MNIYKNLEPSLYFSTQTHTRAERQIIKSIYAFYKEIENITLNYTDIHIAHIKLQWWRGEVIKIQEGAASHPLTKQLPASVTQALLEIIEGLEQNLTCPEF